MCINKQKFINFLIEKGFIYPSSSIYGGLSNSWDYGPLGSELKQNIKNKWWNYFVYQSLDIVGLDSSIILNKKVWESSGHLDNFLDPLVDCKECKNRFKVDDLIDNYEEILNNKKIINLNTIAECPKCNSKNFTEIRDFNLMFKTHQGVTDNSVNEVYLRPETAQGIFINFKNIYRSSCPNLPFGVAQIGKSFRNEITPSNFIFRTREFEQMEIEYFYDPQEYQNYFDDFLNKSINFLKELGITSNFKIVEHSKDKLAHYSKKTVDIEYKFPFGWKELWGIAHRGNFDLEVHNKNSDVDLKVLSNNQKIIPEVIEPSVGVERLIYALLLEHYNIKKDEHGREWEYLTLPYEIAPIKIAILPLVKKLSNECINIFKTLSPYYRCVIENKNSIGKRYKKQDAIGTPYCITFDYDSLEDNMVTIRDRDSKKQTRVDIKELKKYFNNKFGK